MATKKTTTTTAKANDFSVFSQEVSPSLLAQAIHIYRENSHRGVSKTKSRGEVDLTKHKVYKQKGTGNARHGAKSAPIYVGGGVAFGPTGIKSAPKSLNQKMKVKSLIGILSLYNKEDRLSLVDISSLSTSNTKKAAALFGDTNSTLVHFDESQQLIKSVSNLKNLTLCSARRLNTYDVASSPKVYFTPTALELIIKRLKLSK
nr:ribosomal protein L4 [uncultured bacterium]